MDPQESLFIVQIREVRTYIDKEAYQKPVDQTLINLSDYKKYLRFVELVNIPLDRYRWYNLARNTQTGWDYTSIGSKLMCVLTLHEDPGATEVDNPKEFMWSM